MKTIDFSRFNLYTVVRDLIINIWIIVIIRFAVISHFDNRFCRNGVLFKLFA